MVEYKHWWKTINNYWLLRKEKFEFEIGKLEVMKNGIRIQIFIKLEFVILYDFIRTDVRVIQVTVRLLTMNLKRLKLISIK